MTMSAIRSRPVRTAWTLPTFSSGSRRDRDGEEDAAIQQCQNKERYDPEQVVAGGHLPEEQHDGERYKEHASHDNDQDGHGSNELSVDHGIPVDGVRKQRLQRAFLFFTGDEVEAQWLWPGTS